jgi:hypothetical protein
MPKTNNKKQHKLPPEWVHIESFFLHFGPKESDEQFWQMLKLALTSIDDQGSPEERSLLIAYYTQAKALINASYNILQQAKKQYGIKPLKA